jgi:hypothetical protein
MNGSIVTLEAYVVPDFGSGSIQFKVQGVNVGAPVPLDGSAYYSIPYTITQPPGAYAITAVVTVTAPGVIGSTGTGTLTVTGKPQTITFNAIPAQVAGASVNLSTYASATSSLAVSFASLTSAVCTVTGMTARMFSAGTCTIQASQTGNSVYSPADPVSGSIVVSPAPATNFTIKANPPTQTAFRGVLAAFLLELKSVNSFNGNVKLSCVGGPAEAKCANLPQTVKLNGTAHALSGILFPKNTTPGTYTVTFTGLSGSLTNSTTATFTVK